MGVTSRWTAIGRATLLSAVLSLNSAATSLAADGPDVFLTPGLRLSAPLGLSASATMVVAPHRSVVGRDYCGHNPGLLVQAEAGTGGGQAALGYGVACNTKDTPLGIPLDAIGVRVVVTRTWGATWLASAQSTYIGAVIDGTFLGFTARIGASHRISEGPPSRRWVAHFGLGVGF